MATITAQGVGSTSGGAGPLPHTIAALTAGRRLVVLNDSSGYGYTDSAAGITGVTIGGVAMTRIGYIFSNGGGTVGITSCYVSDPLTGGETSIAVSSDAAGFWGSDIVWAEVTGLDQLLDVEASNNGFSVSLSVGFTTGYDNSLGISCGAGGTPSTSGWANVTGSTTAAINADVGSAGAKTLAFVDLGEASGRNVAVYAIRAASGGVTGDGAATAPAMTASGTGEVDAAAASVTLTNPLASAGFRLRTMPDLAAGDIVEYEIVSGTGTLTVNVNGSFVASAGVLFFQYRVNDGGGFGAWTLQEVRPQGVRPATTTSIPTMTAAGSGTVA